MFACFVLIYMYMCVSYCIYVSAFLPLYQYATCNRSQKGQVASYFTSRNTVSDRMGSTIKEIKRSSVGAHVRVCDGGLK